MKGHTSFEDILAEKLGVTKKNDPQKATPSKDYTIGIPFLGQKIFRTTSFPYKNLGIKNPTQPEPVKPPAPVTREKRVFTKTQKEALEILQELGDHSVDEFTTDAEVRSTFRKLAKQFHPDLARGRELLFEKLVKARKLFFSEAK